MIGNHDGAHIGALYRQIGRSFVHAARHGSVDQPYTQEPIERKLALWSLRRGRPRLGALRSFPRAPGRVWLGRPGGGAAPRGLDDLKGAAISWRLGGISP